MCTCCRGLWYIIPRHRGPSKVGVASAGKALYQMTKDMIANGDQWAGRNVIFLHTGGLLGIYEKAEQLTPLVQRLGKAHRMHVQDI